MKKTKMYYNTGKSDSTQTLSECDPVSEEQAYLCGKTAMYFKASSF